MAALVARRCLLRCSGTAGAHAGANATPAGKLPCFTAKGAPQQRAAYGDRRGTNGDPDAGVHVHVPVDRLTVSYSRSGGPGGQHVNKANTKAEVRFHVGTADWIPEDVRQKILDQNKNRISKAGELLVTSELSRSQQRNLRDCVEKLSAIIAAASEKPKEPAAEDVALWAARLDKRNKERRRQKKIQSAAKQSRRVDPD